MTYDEIIRAIDEDIRLERRSGRVPETIRLGANVRNVIADFHQANGATLSPGSPDRLLGYPISPDPAIDPDGVVVEYADR